MYLPACSLPDPASLADVSERSRRIAAGVVETWADLRLVELIEYAARVTGVCARDIVGRDRSARTVAARQIAFWICRRSGVYSYPAIGRAFGRDHTCALRGARKADAMLPPGGLTFDRAIAKSVRDRLRLFSVISGGRP